MKEERRVVKVSGRIFEIEKVMIPGTTIETSWAREIKGKHTMLVREAGLIMEVLQSLRDKSSQEG